MSSYTYIGAKPTQFKSCIKKTTEKVYYAAKDRLLKIDYASKPVLSPRGKNLIPNK